MPPEIASHLLTWIPAAALFAVGVRLLWPLFLRRRRQKALCRTLHLLGPQVRDAIVVEDGLDGLAFIGHAVLTPRGVAVVEVMPNDGAVFGAEQSDLWANVVGHRTTRFPNPLARVREQVSAIRFGFPRLPVRGLVLFTGHCQFPKGKPDGVVVPAELATDRPPTAVPATLRRAWDEFMSRCDENAEHFRRESALAAERFGYGGAAGGVVLLLLAIVWAVVVR